MLLAALLLVRCINQSRIYGSAPSSKKAKKEGRSGEKIGGRYVCGIDYTYILVSEVLMESAIKCSTDLLLHGHGHGEQQSNVNI